MVSGTGGQESIKAGRGLRGFVHGVTLLNTDSNLTNTSRTDNRTTGMLNEDSRKQISSKPTIVGTQVIASRG